MNDAGISTLSTLDRAVEFRSRQVNVEHELTRKGIQKFVSDYKSTLRKAS